MCGGTLNIEGDASVAVCEYCGTKQTLPKLDSEKKIQLYDRANHFRRQNEFDKAMGIYEMLLAGNKEDSEAYWGIVLCRYGIEYVEDPRSHKRIPTINRAQFASIFDDADYLSAIKYADGYQKDIYKSEAETINKIQKRILEISSKEEPFDVFICYKETDEHGERTQDSVYAQDIYTALTKEGYKVFFSRITLESKLGSAYEPYIFAALQSAKVMLVVGTSKENFNAVWVKNEWSRYLSLIKEGKEKTLIPVYKNMDPYDMPEEFTYLQSQDMGKIGFMQDLVRGVRKLFGKRIAVSPEKKAQKPQATASIESLLRRAALYLEDGDWESAETYSNRVLDIQPENPEAYLAGLMAEFHCKKMDDLANLPSPFNQSKNYEKIMRFADKDLREDIAQYLEAVNERVYEECQNLLSKAETEKDYLEIIQLFRMILEYKDVDSQVASCIQKVKEIRENNNINAEMQLKMHLLEKKLKALKQEKEQVCIEKDRMLQNLYQQQEKKKIVKSISDSYGWFVFLGIVIPILTCIIIVPVEDGETAGILISLFMFLFIIAIMLPILLIQNKTKELGVILPNNQKMLPWSNAKRMFKHGFTIEQTQATVDEKIKYIGQLTHQIAALQVQRDTLSYEYAALAETNPSLKKAIYDTALKYQEKNTIEDLHIAINGFSKILDWKDSKMRVDECTLHIQKITERMKRENAEQQLQHQKNEGNKRKKEQQNELIRKILLSIIPTLLALIWLFFFIMCCFVDKSLRETIPMGLLLGTTIYFIVDIWKSSKENRKKKNITFGIISFILFLFFSVSLFSPLSNENKELIKDYYGEGNYKVLEEINLIEYAEPSDINTETGEFKTDKDGHPLEIKMEDGKIVSIFITEEDMYIYNTEMDTADVYSYPSKEKPQQEDSKADPKETHSEESSDKKVYTLGTQEYYDEISRICTSNSENTSLSIYKTDGTRYPYYYFYFKLNKKMDQNQYEKEVNEICNNIYNDIMKYDYKKKGIMNDTGGIISLNFVMYDLQNPGKKITVEMRVLNMEKNKSYNENVIVFD